MRRCLSGLVVLAVAVACHAQTPVFQPNELVAASEGTPRNERPRVAFSDDGSAHILWAHGSVGEDGAFLTTAPPGGDYGEAVMLSPGMNGVGAGGGAGPTLRALGSYIAAGWEDTNLENRGIWVARSTEMGSTWEPALRADPQIASSRAYESVGLFPDGRLSQIWMAPDEGGTGPGYEWTGQDGNGVFTEPIEATASASGSACPCCYADQIILDDGQTVLVAFRNNEGDIRDVRVVRSTDGGASFTSLAQVDDSGWYIQGCPATGPGLAADGSHVLVCWMSAAGVGARIWSARSSDGGDTWEPKVRVDDSGGDYVVNYPQVAVRGGLAVVVWEGTGPDTFPAIFAAASADGGWSWGDPVVVTDDVGHSLQGQPSVAVSPTGEIEVVWKDARLGSDRLFHARGQVDVTSAPGTPPEAAGLVLHAPYPNPMRTPLAIPFTLERSRHVRLSVHDVSGWEVVCLVNRHLDNGSRQIVWNGLDARGRSVPSGVYYLQLVSEGQHRVERLIVVR